MSHSITRPCLVSPTPHFSSDDLHLLVHPTHPRWIVLNNQGYEVALLCDGHHSTTQIAKHLANTYNLENSLASRHVDNYLSSMAEKGWFSPVEYHPPKKSFNLNNLCVQITERCNLRCKHCYSWDNRSPAELSLDQIIPLIDQAKDMDGKLLTLSGGEPLLHPQFSEIIKYTGSSLKIQILSNGTLIDSDTAELLGDHGVKVQVSIDGSTADAHDKIRGPGAYEKSMKGIKLLQDAGVEVVICAVAMRENIRDLDGLVRLAQDCKSSTLRIIPLRCSGRAADNWEDISPDSPEYVNFCRRHLLDDDKKISVSCGLSGLVLTLPQDQYRWCPIGNIIIVNAQGESYPCLILTNKNHCLGHIKDISLSQILSSTRLEQIRKIRDNRLSTIPKCAACPWKYFCQAGCMGMGYAQRKSFGETDDQCYLRQELYPQLIFELVRKKSLPNNTKQIPGILV